MTKRKIVLYVYNTYTQEVNTYFDMILERQIVDMESRNEYERVYAINPAQKRRCKISDKPGVVFDDYDSNAYRVWFDEPDYDGAVHAISSYILDRLNPLIRDTEQLLDRQKAERLAAINLLEK